MEQYLRVALKTLGVKKGVLTTHLVMFDSNACKWLGLKTIFSDIETKSFQ